MFFSFPFPLPISPFSFVVVDLVFTTWVHTSMYLSCRLGSSQVLQLNVALISWLLEESVWFIPDETQKAPMHKNQHARSNKSATCRAPNHEPFSSERHSRHPRELTLKLIPLLASFSPILSFKVIVLVFFKPGYQSWLHCKYHLLIETDWDTEVWLLLH